MKREAHSDRPQAARLRHERTAVPMEVCRAPFAAGARRPAPAARGAR